MVSLNEILQVSNSLIAISITLIVALFILTRTILNMVMKKRIGVFRPFFVFGLGLCLVAGFMFYDFYGVATDVYVILKFIVVLGIFCVLIRGGKTS